MVNKFFINCRKNLLDLVELNYNSVSFFDLLKKESAISRWSRAGKRAAMVNLIEFFFYLNQFYFSFKNLIMLEIPFMQVGKGLSKNEKGQKLVLEHWLEAVSNIFLFICSIPLVFDLL